MDEMTQHNAALVEEMNASIEQTEAQATQLDAIVDVFMVETAAETRRALPVHQAPKARPQAAPERVKAAGRAYLSQGNAALDADWNEF